MPWHPKLGPLPLKSSTAIHKSSLERDGKPGPRAFVFALQHRKRATRTSVPKVRSGCTTCKRRHVKCDEGKPACQRCLKLKGSCEGYGTSDEQCSSRERSISPGSASSQLDADGSAMLPRYGELLDLGVELAPVPTDDSRSLYAQWEGIYFEHWLTLSENLGGGWFPSPLFGQIIPQLCRTEPAVRYAAIAVGALAMSLAPYALQPPSAETVEKVPHYNRALTFHGQALRLVRLLQDLGSDFTLRIALISCIIFACFEALHSSYSASINHINHGSMIVEQLMRSPEFPLDKEIFLVFQRLENLSWSARLTQDLPGTSPIFICSSRCRYGCDMPTIFSSTTEARDWLELVQHRALRLIAVQRRLDDQNSNFPSKGGSDTLKEPSLEILKQWSVAFEPLYVRATGDDSEGESDLRLQYLQATSLQLQYHAAWVHLRLVLPTTQETPAAMTPRFQQIVQLAAIILPNQPKPTGHTGIFTMDHGPIRALFTVATKCLEPAVCADAVLLLEKYPRRDAFWDSQAVLRLVKTGAECNGTTSI